MEQVIYLCANRQEMPLNKKNMTIIVFLNCHIVRGKIVKKKLLMSLQQKGLTQMLKRQITGFTLRAIMLVCGTSFINLALWVSAGMKSAT